MELVEPNIGLAIWTIVVFIITALSLTSVLVLLKL